ncbi:hypothetical protein [Aquimarina spongiae]|uniref:Uncharacterized protein n=1 Tax=Aquimarina spongiae TaxID=570521 RepID=A0A1M6JEF9_9FLAO|nr:hypothetical protein [Aquimarina spongiae]SHJ45034.1 hypothetical protein SAMN04488508_10920 [Aquimarina spongiae]
MRENNKKPLPWCPTKEQVHTIYVQVSTKTLRDEIFAAMQEHRKKSFDQIKNIKKLLHPEWVKIVKFLGIPNGYYAPDGFFDMPE